MFVSLAGYLLGWVLGGLWMAYGGVFGPLSDLSPIVVYLPLGLVAWCLHRSYGTPHRWSSTVVLVVGWTGMALSVISGAGLVLWDPSGPAQVGNALLVGQMVGVGIVGLWFLGVSVLEFRTGVVGRRVAWAGLVAGSGSVLLALASVLWDLEHPAFFVGALLALAGTVLWSVWLGRNLLARDA